jgi:hypothetical protein
MNERNVAIAAGVAFLAIVVTGFLLIGAVSAAPDRTSDARPRVFFGDRPPAAARTLDQLEERMPAEVRALLPIQRNVAIAARDAARYVLLLLGIGAVMVFARGQVVAAYRALLGGPAAVARAGLLGLALLAVAASATFLVFVALLGSFAEARGAGTFGIRVGVAQLGVTILSAGLLIVAVVALIGFAAAAWRLGDAALSLGPLRRLGQTMPATLVVVASATLIYLLAQIPLVGSIITIAAIAFGLGSAAAARLAHAPAS